MARARGGLQRVTISSSVSSSPHEPCVRVRDVLCGVVFIFAPHAELWGECVVVVAAVEGLCDLLFAQYPVQCVLCLFARLVASP